MSTRWSLHDTQWFDEFVRKLGDAGADQPKLDELARVGYLAMLKGTGKVKIVRHEETDTTGVVFSDTVLSEPIWDFPSATLVTQLKLVLG